MARLLEILRGGGSCAMDDAEWAAMLVLAEEEHVSAWVVARLLTSREALPEGRRLQIEQIARTNSMAAFYWSCELKTLLSSFAVRSIAVVALKGPVLAERIYGGTALRGCRDLDLLVAFADVRRAEAVLSDCGFLPQESDDYHRAWSRRGTVVELHHDVENPLAYNFAVAKAIQRSGKTSFQGEYCRQFAPQDELVYLCLHATRHRYDRLSLVLDLRLAFEKLPTANHLLMQRDHVRALDGLVALGLEMVRRLDPEFRDSIEMRVSAKYGAHLAMVADRLWRELTTRRTSSPLDWRAAHAFYMEIEEPGFGRVRRWMRHMRILSRRVIDADSAFAARFGLHGTLPARLLRPARLVSDAIAGHRDNRSID